MKPKSLTLSNNSYILPLSVSEHIAFVDLFAAMAPLKDKDGNEIELRPIHWSVVTAIINCYDDENEWILLEFLPEEAFLLVEDDLSDLSRKQVMETLLTVPEYFYRAIMKASDNLLESWVSEVWRVCEVELDKIYVDTMEDLKKKETVPEVSTGS